MFRVTRYVKSLLEPTPVPPAHKPPGPVVIWNLIRRCNLTCKHCYTVSADIDFKGELSTQEVFSVLDDLKRFRVPALILSGGEPLMRPDIFEISQRAKELGIYTGLSTNGTLIDESNIERIAECGYDYVGISIDGLEATHDDFRRRKGAFRESMHAVKLCKQHGIKVGLRFTLTQQNYEQLDDILALIDEHDVDKFYLSHLNYGGRGHRHRKQDAWYQMTRDAMTRLFDHCRAELERGIEREYVTGNNDADGPFLLMWAREHFPEQAEALEQRLVNWGGNASGEHIANIDNLGTVHPDTFWWDHDIGNVRQQPFSEIWSTTQDELMQGFRQRPRPLKGRCADCRFLSICNGNTRVRAWKVTNDPWEEDPGCYLSNEEIGVEADRQRRVAAPHDAIQSVEL
ncbi:heme d1 biosynthesis radical SAM protein NirJ [Billgrantia kenyensis]|uniref:Pre-heme d1 synthase n=1 Tax=Billgrantia kenyensis TaxID=321266 RepID=A0A7V9W265_9GAMM|nr:heme d1 biosynthesis radical SAM protein NirJ [Halomonas kenyensis]MBA2779671.1 heme d1 biosynthesis radical SAM protein NirJ [Halomonas kenyensis]MCG6662644.1 heme d1 biosynthesis radical SAM protein NirJ [Halomonas kenyensis]